MQKLHVCLLSAALVLIACSQDAGSSPSTGATSASGAGAAGSGSTGQGGSANSAQSGTGGSVQSSSASSSQAASTGAGGSCAAGGPANCTGTACACTAEGFIPLPDMGAASYQGQSGGLYGSGSNSRPPAHEAAGLSLAQSIGPLSPTGSPDPTGKYVFLSIGISNTTQEFSTFVPIGMMDPAKDPNLVLIDGAQSGITANLWADPNHPAWGVVNQRLTNSGLTPAQVAVAWVKVAVPNPMGTFPMHAQQLQGYMTTIAQNLFVKFPNLKLAYYSSRIYAGYATGVSTLNPEPYAYESGFSVQWLVTAQIGGAPELAFQGPGAKAPWLSWGPYLWADGMNPRCDGLVWECSDLVMDGTHPSQTGRQKVAQMLLDFVKTDTTAREWFLANP